MSARTLALLSLAAVGASPLAAQERLFDRLHGMLPRDIDVSGDVAWGDVDGDGDLDALIANGNFQSRLYLNQGTGLFLELEGAVPEPGGSSMDHVVLDDLNGDGHLDLAAVSITLLNRVYLGDGTGSFSELPGALPDVGGTLGRDLVSEDLDGDGDVDLVVGRLAAAPQLMLNDGNANFTLDLSFPTGATGSNSLALGDANGDGNTDLFAGALFGQPALLLGDGAGGFTLGGSLPIGTAAIVSATFVDVNGDGSQDLAFADTNGAGLWHGDGTGVFTDASDDVPSGLPSHLVAGDVDGDGDQDLAAAIPGNIFVPRRNHVLLNDGSGVFATAPDRLPDPPANTFRVALEDVDGDGDLDYLSLNQSTQSRLYLNDGGGQFTDVTGSEEEKDMTGDFAALGDLDGDGDLDAMASFQLGLRLFTNDGTGIFRQDLDQPPAGAGFGLGLSLGDLDADGDLDVVLGNTVSLLMSLNDGAGAFTDASLNLPPVSAFMTWITLADLGAGGGLDIIVATTLGQPTVLLRNNGSGVFSDASASLPFHDPRSQRVAAVDVDGDGDQDLVLANNFEDHDLFLNDGTGQFTDASSNLPSSASVANGLHSGDVDGDGDTDLLINNNPSAPTLFLNDGGGVFSDGSDALAAFVLGATAGVEDLNGDGIADILGSNGTLLVSDGLGGFTDRSDLLPPTESTVVTPVLGDVDGDGDVDQFLSGLTRVHFNLTRQVAWRGVPRVGKELAIDSYGTPGATAVLVGSRGEDNVEIPGLGVLRVDLSRVAFVRVATLGPGGRATETFQVPSSVNLVGKSVYWQGVIGVPFRFTNLEVTTFSDL